MSVTEPSSTAELPERGASEPASEVAAVPVDTPPAPAPAKLEAVRRERRSLLEWFWRGKTLAEARARLETLQSAERALLARARVAAELGDRALDPVDPLRSGSSVPLALSLYREALYWALLAQAPGSEARDLRAAFDQTPAEVLAYAAGDSAEELAAVRQALVEKDFVDIAQETAEEQQRAARFAAAFVHALIRRKLGDEWRVGRVLVERWLRTGAVLVLVVGALIAAAVLFGSLSLSPDLALGKPWRASSTYVACRTPDHTCGDLKIFFHTEEEDNPWVEIDLKKSRKIGRIDVHNRPDAAQERALPLVLEVSGDAKSWKQVARRDEPFVEWNVEFKPVTARYVRARVPRRTYFHLERISVREH